MTQQEINRIAELEAKANASNTNHAAEDARIAELEAKMGAPQQADDRNFLEKGLEEYVLPIVAPIGEFVDTYTGAPTRAGLGAISKGENPLSAAYDQFGEDPALAPTGKDLVKNSSLISEYAPSLQSETPLSDVFPSAYSETGKEWFKLKRGGLLDPTPSGVAGLGVDVLADPTNIISGAGIIKGAGKGIKSGVRGLTKSLVKGSKIAGEVVDAATGLKTFENLGNGARGAKNLVNDATGALKGMVKTTVKADADKLAKVAAKHGIDPNILPARTKYDGLLPRLEEAQAYGAGGDELLRNNQLVFNQLDDAIEKSVEKIGGAYDPVMAGEIVKEGYKKSLDNLFNENAIRYSNLSELSPGMRLTDESAINLNKTLNGLEKKMKGLSVRGISEQKKMAKDVLSQIESIRASGGNVKQLTEQISEIGSLAHSPSSSFKLPIDQKSFRDIYDAMKDSIVSTADDVAPEIGAQLRQSNKNISEYMKNLAPIEKALQSKTISPEGLFKALTADSSKLESMFKMLDPESAKQLKGAIISSLVKSGANDATHLGRTMSALKKARPKLSKVFTVNELSELEELLDLGINMGGRLKQTLPPTGATDLLKNLVKRVPESLIDKKIIESLKKGKLSAPEMVEMIKAQSSTKAAAPAAGKGLFDELGGAVKTPRSTFEKRLKLLQSFAPQGYQEE